MKPVAPRRIKIRHLLLVVVIAIGAFLLLMPTKVQPLAWTRRRRLR